MNSKENLDTCRTCATCKHFKLLAPLLTGEVGYCSIKKEYRFPIKHCRRYEPADKFKALQEDTNLALIQQNKQTKPRKRNKKYRK